MIVKVRNRIYRYDISTIQYQSYPIVINKNCTTLTITAYRYNTYARIFCWVETAESQETIDDHHAPSIAAPNDVSRLSTIAETIRDVLAHETRYTSIHSRMLLVPLASLPSAQVASLLAISQSYARCLLFQAKVDKLYLTRGVKLQEYRHTQCHVQRDVIHHAVNFVYSDENIGRIAWEARNVLQIEISGGRSWRMFFPCDHWY